jgi:hypothetical protein
MTMAISGVSLAPPASFQNPNDPRQQFAQLAKAISSGDLSAAQQAYAQLSQTLGNNPNGSAGSNSNDPFAQALASIGQALQSGDVGGAQQALASLQQQAQGARGHHHHGHRGGAGQNGDATATNAETASVTISSTTGTTLDVTA